MTDGVELLARGALIGVGAAALMDVWAHAITRTRGSWCRARCTPT